MFAWAWAPDRASHPLVVTGLAQALAPAATNGSLVSRDGQEIGSSLLGQDFARPEYLHPHPSANGYQTLPAAASPLGPSSQKLVAAVTSRRAAFIALNGQAAPLDTVTKSASGLNTDVSLQNVMA